MIANATLKKETTRGNILIGVGILNSIALLVHSSPVHATLSVIHVGAMALAFVIHGYLLLTPGDISLSKTVKFFIALPLILAVLTLPADSHDLYSYAFYGWTVAHYHQNPYLVTPAHFPHDFMAHRVSHGWINAPSVYGPLFTLISAVAVSITQSAFGVHAIFQGISLLGLVAMAYFTHKLFGQQKWVVLLLTSPLCVVSVVNGGHNDTLVGAGILAGLYLFSKQKHLNAALVLLLACSVKLVALLVPAALVVYLLRNKVYKAASEMFFVGFLGTLAAQVAFAPHLLSSLSKASHLDSLSSVWSVIINGYPLSVDETSWNGIGRHALLANSTWALVVIALLCAYLVLISNSRRSYLYTVAAVVFAYLASARYVLPWYAIWALPLAFIAFNKRQRVLVTLYVGSLFLGYLKKTWIDPHALTAMLSGIAGGITPVLALLLIKELVWPSGSEPPEDTEQLKPVESFA